MQHFTTETQNDRMNLSQFLELSNMQGPWADLIIQNARRAKTVVIDVPLDERSMKICNGKFENCERIEVNNQQLMRNMTEHSHIYSRVFCNVREVALGEQIHEVYSQTFNGYKRLKTVRMYAKPVIVRGMAFSGCSGLEELVLVNSDVKDTFIARNAFSGMRVRVYKDTPSARESMMSFAFGAFKNYEKIDRLLPKHICWAKNMIGLKKLEDEVPRAATPVALKSDEKPVCPGAPRPSIKFAELNEDIAPEQRAGRGIENESTEDAPLLILFDEMPHAAMPVTPQCDKKLVCPGAPRPSIKFAELNADITPEQRSGRGIEDEFTENAPLPTPPSAIFRNSPEEDSRESGRTSNSDEARTSSGSSRTEKGCYSDCACRKNDGKGLGK